MIRQAMIREIEHEGLQTKRILERIPVDNFNWKPHEKSREIGQLSIHVAYRSKINQQQCFADEKHQCKN